MKQKTFYKKINEIIDKERFSIIKINGKNTNYMISSNGYVISNNYRNTGTPQKLKEEYNHGYKRVTLFIDNELIHKRVHRLVAEAFIPNPNNYNICHHKDDDKTNNKVSNIEWTTSQGNSDYALEDGLILYGVNHPNANNSEEQIISVCEYLEENIYTIKEISNLTGVSVNAISSIIFNNTWKSISKDYNITNYTVRENAKKLDENIVSNICNLLSKTTLSHAEIANIIGIKPYIVTDILNKKTYINISNKYDFSSRI